MNIFSLSYKNVIARPLNSFLSFLLLGFGVSIVVLILLISSQLKSEISKNSKGIDLVVAAKGSPLQIILANIFHIDFPTGNISLKEASEISHNRYIQSAIPLSLGDSYNGFRIVGTTKAYGELYDMKVSEGAWFADHMEAIIGAEVARKLDLNIGDRITSQHGLSSDGDGHDDNPFVVTGIFESNSSVVDRLILVDLPSVWHVHGHEDHENDSLVSIAHLGIEVTREQLEQEEITSLLIKYRSPMGAVTLPRQINSNSNFQAASPAFETARLFNIIGVGVKVVNILGILIIIISAISVFIALLNSLKDRKYDIAIMRSMGASRAKVFLLIISEGMVISLASALVGLMIAHTLLFVIGWSIHGVDFSAWYLMSEEFLVLVGCLLVGLMASIIPAIFAYKTDISETLSKG